MAMGGDETNAAASRQNPMAVTGAVGVRRGYPIPMLLVSIITGCCCLLNRGCEIGESARGSAPRTEDEEFSSLGLRVDDCFTRQHPGHCNTLLGFHPYRSRNQLAADASRGCQQICGTEILQV